MQIKRADAIMRTPLQFLRSAIKASESGYPPWHVQPKSKPKTFDSILKFVSSTVKVTPRHERYRKVTNIFGRNCCSRLLTIAHDFSRSLIFFDRYIVAIFAENVPFEVLGSYFLGPLCYMLTIAHDCSRLLTIYVRALIARTCQQICFLTRCLHVHVCPAVQTAGKI